MLLKKMFYPQSVAIIGASSTPGKVGFAILKNMVDAGYSGKIHPINPKASKILGIKAKPSVLKVKGKIDMAVVVVPAKIVPSVLKECAKKGIRNVVIISAGFSETGKKGKKIGEEISKIIEENGMNVVGPNTLGIINTENSLNASFSASMPSEGKIALVSQSGALCTAILDWARQEKIGFSKFISSGNKSFMGEGEYFSYLEKDRNTKAVFVYMESVKNHENFLERAASLAKKKPVILLKSGRSSVGQKAASSHTGAMSEDDEIFSVACDKANIIRVNSIEGFFDMAKLLSKIETIKGLNLGVVTNAGGPGVIIADSATRHDFPLPEFSKSTLNAVKKINPYARNPLDLIGDARPIDYRTALGHIIKDKKVDLIYSIVTPQMMTEPDRIADIIVDINTKTNPIICSFMGGTGVAHAKRYLREHGVAEYETPERGIKALSRFAEYTKQKQKKTRLRMETKPKKKIREMLKGKKHLRMEEAEELLKEFGIPMAKSFFFSNKKELGEMGINYPVALKTDIGEIAHRTEHGLAKTGIKNKKELEREHERMAKKIKKIGKKPRFVVQEMVEGEEVLVSSITKGFGKIITYGLGGIFVEVMKDFSQKIAPLTDEDIEEIVSEVKGTEVLKGARKTKKLDVECMKGIIKSVSKMALTYPEIKEIEFNPLFVTRKGCFVVDAIITL